MPTSSVLKIAESKLGQEAAVDFLSWAFGSEYPKTVLSEATSLWNELHSDLLELEHIGEDLLNIERMIVAWKITAPTVIAAAAATPSNTSTCC